MLLVLCSRAYAQQEFTVVNDTTYTVDKQGGAEVEQRISLTNNFSKIYASSYTLKLEGKKPDNVQVELAGVQMPVEVKESEGKYEILINFPDALVGRGKTRSFTVRYKHIQVATQNGKVWDVSIPKLAGGELISQYGLNVKVPKTFGVPAYISPEPRLETEEGSLQVFSFQKEDVAKAGIVAAFGDFQIFSFDVNYHLPNLSTKEIETEIALIPDTAYQRVYYENISPKPSSVRVDEDGNWMAKYKVGPNQSFTVAVKTSVQIFSQPQEHYVKDMTIAKHYLQPAEKWQTDDPEIQSLAKTLKNPRQIYDFVVSKLNYDYGRVREDVERYGAKKALENPDNAICMEFTDLFIALARAAGIPAREINGYAHTENRQLQPLSLVADVLHAWPEYWDIEAGVWQPVDPTWEDTTGGINFYDKFDLSHVTFAIHGKMYNYPLPAGSYKEEDSPQKDVQVQFGTLPNLRGEQLKIEINPSNSFFLPFSFDLPFLENSYEIKVSNQGQTALYNRSLTVSGGQLSVNKNINFLAPYDSILLEAKARSPFFPFGKENSLEAKIGDFSADYPLNSEHVLTSRIILFFALVLTGMGIIFSPHFFIKIKRALKN